MVDGWEEQLLAYIFDGAFDSQVVDVVINALSNLTNTTCDVYTEADVTGDLEKSTPTVAPSPERGHTTMPGHITLFFKGLHYEPLIPIKGVSKMTDALHIHYRV